MRRRRTSPSVIEYRSFEPAPFRGAMAVKRITVASLAAERGCHPVHLSAVLNGRTDPSVDLVRWLCVRLDVPEAEVIGDSIAEEVAA